MDYCLEEGVDRISSLPDDILCHILSFLPTKIAVASTILSTRWKYLWSYVPVLDFDTGIDQSFYPLADINVCRESEVTFQRFVSRVLLLNDMPRIQKFRLIYECHYSSAPIRTWFHVIVSRSIQELELDFCLCVRDERIELPKKFFLSNSLVVMKLSRMPLKVPTSVCFPRLKILELRRIMYLDDKCTQNLLSGCPVLEELMIEEIAREKAKVVHISIHTLKRLSFGYKYVIDIMLDCPYKFIINAPNLEYFYIKGRISDDFVMNNVSNLITAHLDLHRTAVSADNYGFCHQRVCDLFKKVATVKFLFLSSEIATLLGSAYDRSLPRFSNLQELAFSIGFDFCWKRLLTEFIKCSPYIEVVNLNNKQVLLREIEEQSKIPPQPMPEYLLSHLKNILIVELYTNFIPEFVENLVQDVNVLKRLKINCQCPVMLRSQIGLTS